MLLCFSQVQLENAHTDSLFACGVVLRAPDQIQLPKTAFGGWQLAVSLDKHVWNLGKKVCKLPSAVLLLLCLASSLRHCMKEISNFMKSNSCVLKLKHSGMKCNECMYFFYSTHPFQECSQC
jgi:hypothetical protein